MAEAEPLIGVAADIGGSVAGAAEVETLGEKLEVMPPAGAGAKPGDTIGRAGINGAEAGGGT